MSEEKNRFNKIYDSLVEEDRVTIPVDVLQAAEEREADFEQKNAEADALETPELDEANVTETLSEEVIEAEEVNEIEEPEELAEINEDLELIEEEETTELEEIPKEQTYSLPTYQDLRQTTYGDLLSLIDEAERELADLKFRKQLMESDFNELMSFFNQVFIIKTLPISAIAEDALLEYFTYELLKPLEKHDLRLSDHQYSVWETKHFELSYQLIDNEMISFELILPRSDDRLLNQYIPLMDVFPGNQKVIVSDEAVLEILTGCFSHHIFTSGQISFFSFEINTVLANMKQLGFEIEDNLLDNSKPLNLDYQLPHTISEEVLDDIFITAMNNERHDFQKLAEDEYLVALENEQTVTIKQQVEEDAATLKINSGYTNKSLIEFFGTYQYLVDLAMTQ
ncbi:hypothetical protein [Enterococcus alishanensis]|uniref:hypothetical protein n=1 Tax=Enterococcus alishanensis TaxID=1303817 RepID=UPI001FED16D9|nr:hypothetical protein [Enterococcus alishanensis]